MGIATSPSTWTENPRLRWWVVSLRRKKREGKLDRRQISQLNRLGFVWEPALKPSWSEMYAALVEYKRVHGDCNVPYDWSGNPYLGTWIRRQRHARKANRLEQGRIEQLDKLGFAWDYFEYQWESKYAALVKFREEYGHCRVSTLSKPHAALANWVRTMRVRKRQGKLSAERIRRLDLLGFTWDMPRRKSGPIENAPQTGVPEKPSRSRPQERLASAICRQRYLALARDVVEILRSATLAYRIVATFPDNRLRYYQSVQPCADRCLGNSEMSCHFCHGAALLIREQAEEVLVGHGLPVSRRLGCGRLGYAFHNFALIKRGGPSRSA